jgi:hypothetical protein
VAWDKASVKLKGVPFDQEEAQKAYARVFY